MTRAALRSFEAGAFTLAADDFALLASAARIRDGFLAEHLGDLAELGPTEASVPSKDRVWLTLSVAIPGLLGGTAFEEESASLLLKLLKSPDRSVTLDRRRCLD